MKIEDWMRPITDAARIVKASLPTGHAFELADLVQIGAERVLRYMGGTPGTQSVLVYVCAKQGMLYEARRWDGRDPHGLKGTKARKAAAPILTGYHEWMRSTPRPQYEAMIDAKRDLLAMPLREAVAWHSHHWLGEPLDKLEPEFGVTAGRIRQYCASANARLARDTDIVKRASTKYAANRARYAELRRLGASKREATSASKGIHAYALMVARLGGESSSVRVSGRGEGLT